MRITVLADNSVCKTNTMNVKPVDVLSLFIEFDERIILFDTGQSDLFIQNAEKMGIDLSQVHYLIVSHGNFNHGGGLNRFLKINEKAIIFLHIIAAHKFHTRIFGAIPYYVDTDQKVIARKNRIYFIDEDTLIEDKIILLEGFPLVLPNTHTIGALIEETGYRFFIDKFRHEIVMLLIENDEIVLFSRCLHSGIINTIEEVKLFSKTMRIKATLSGFHINNPIEQKNESHDYVNGLTGNKIQKMNTGQVFEV